MYDASNGRNREESRSRHLRTIPEGCESFLRMNTIPIDRHHGGNPSAGTLDFSASINPLGPPAEAIAAYHDAAARIGGYPPARSERLERALAKWLGCRARQCSGLATARRS